MPRCQFGRLPCSRKHSVFLFTSAFLWSLFRDAGTIPEAEALARVVGQRRGLYQIFSTGEAGMIEWRRLPCFSCSACRSRQPAKCKVPATGDVLLHDLGP